LNEQSGLEGILRPGKLWGRTGYELFFLSTP
jgi:hypothetical protein